MNSTSQKMLSIIENDQKSIKHKYIEEFILKNEETFSGQLETSEYLHRKSEEEIEIFIKYINMDPKFNNDMQCQAFELLKETNLYIVNHYCEIKKIIEESKRMLLAKDEEEAGSKVEKLKQRANKLLCISVEKHECLKKALIKMVDGNILTCSPWKMKIENILEESRIFHHDIYTSLEKAMRELQTVMSIIEHVNHLATSDWFHRTAEKEIAALIEDVKLMMEGIHEGMAELIYHLVKEMKINKVIHSCGIKAIIEESKRLVLTKDKDEAGSTAEKLAKGANDLKYISDEKHEYLKKIVITMVDGNILTCSPWKKKIVETLERSKVFHHNIYIILEKKMIELTNGVIEEPMEF